MTTASDNTWQVQVAKNKFSEVINKALKGVPQLITKNGKPAVYVISTRDYEALTRRKSLKKLLLNSPHNDLEIPIQRQKDLGRDISV
ncbi:MAG TPA: type II toxin-antitoxin system Phd/YefM family antitoxin [Firmicutes bacterium]|nr:type II toxin-antitoxin system Phd/YefM family antitoxin [Bacillota bacterium]HHY98359.1 type II toxin-antitoxin system Phd/YefM family antitoxin [Bacillota bacterium]